MDISSTSATINHSNEKYNFPSDVLKWMKINAKPLMSLKLMQVCKFFQHKKFPYFVLTSLTNVEDRKWDFVLYPFSYQSRMYKTETLDIFDDKKLWITRSLWLFIKIDPFSSILSKIAVCQAYNIILRDQNLTIDEFKILTESGTIANADICNTVISDINGELVSLESILQCLPKIIYLNFEKIVPSFTSVKDAENIAMPKMKKIEADSILETFNFDTFSAFMKSHPSIFCQLEYNPDIPLSPQYAQKLQEYVEKIIEDKSMEYLPSIIHFPGEREKDSNILGEMYYRLGTIRQRDQ